MFDKMSIRTTFRCGSATATTSYVYGQEVKNSSGVFSFIHSLHPRIKSLQVGREKINLIN